MEKIDSSRTIHLSAVLIIALLAILVYSNSLNCTFVFDDQQNITENPYIRLNDFSGTKLIDAAFKSPMATRPLANVTFALNYYFGKYDVRGYHWVNILIHLGNAILVYVFATLTFQHADRFENGTPRRSLSIVMFMALAAALFFMTHPVQVQSVTYIVQRMNSMAAMFYLLALVLYVYARISGTSWKRNLLWGGCLVSWVLALGSKEIAVTLPLVLWLYEWYFFQDLSRDWLKRNVKVLGVLLFLMGMVALIFLGTEPLQTLIGAYQDRDFTMGQRVLTQFRVIVFYLSLLFYPHPSRLNLLHHISTSQSLFEPVTTLLGLLVLTGLLIFAVRLAPRQRLISFGILWFFIHLAIESSVVGLELAFEHRLYLPMVGLSLIAARMGTSLFSTHRGGAVVMAAAMIGSLATATYVRNSVWQDPITLWSDVVSKNPRSHRAHYNLGSDLARRGALDEAVLHLAEALRLKPDQTQAHNNLGLVLFRQGKIEQAMNHFVEALRIEPGNAAAYYNLGLAWKHQNDVAAAVKHYLAALRIKPDFAEAHNSLGIIRQAQGDFQSAVAHFAQAVQINPDDAEAHMNMGSVLETQGNFRQAIEHYFTALRVRPDDAQAYINLGVALTRQGMLKEAVRCYRTALQLKPMDAGAHNNLGVALQQQGRLQESMEHYLQAVKIKPDYAEAHNNLGIILARQKRFKEAVDHFYETLRIRPGDAQARHNLELGLRHMKEGGDIK